MTLPGVIFRVAAWTKESYSLDVGYVVGEVRAWPPCARGRRKLRLILGCSLLHFWQIGPSKAISSDRRRLCFAPYQRRISGRSMILAVTSKAAHIALTLRVYALLDTAARRDPAFVASLDRAQRRCLNERPDLMPSAARKTANRKPRGRRRAREHRETRFSEKLRVGVNLCPRA